MNYGWDDNHNTWYSLDGLYLGGEKEEYMLENIYPAQALKSFLFGIYGRNNSFPYRYFDQDAAGDSAFFLRGHRLQFLPNVTVTCNSTAGRSIWFDGSSSHKTLLFTRGDESRGVRIQNGAIRLRRNGSIRFP